jgi:hypothetical protein
MLLSAMSGAFALLFAMVSGAAAAEPAPAARLSTVVRVQGAADAEILARIEGQTVDLDIDLAVERGRDVEPSLSRQLVTARRLASEREARVVVWFRFVDGARGPETIVYVAEPAADRVLVRRIAHEGSDRAMARSAAAEAAALVVRSSLRALAAGVEIGVAPSEVPDADAEPGPALQGSDSEVPASLGLRDGGAAGSGGTRLHPFVGIGWQAVVDGSASAGQHGVRGRLGLGLGRLRFALDAGASPAVAYTDDLTSIQVSRAQGGLAVGALLIGGGSARLEAEVAAGVVRFSRTTRLRSSEVQATPDSDIYSPWIAPSLRAAWSPEGGRFWLELTAGTDILLRAPEFGYELDGAFVSRNRLWPVEPRVGLGIALDIN